MILQGSVPVDGNGGSDFYDIRKGTNGLIPLYPGKVRIQDGRDTEKQYGLATDILRAAFARMPLVVWIANLPTRQDDSFRNKLPEQMTIF